MNDFYVYKIVNKTNNKFYIGVHKGDFLNDSYYGSGKAIKRAVNKYGKESFKKEVLFIFNNKKEAYLKEKELVDVSMIANKNSYNMKIGGFGGWPIIEYTDKRREAWKNKPEKEKLEYKKNLSRSLIKHWKDSPEARMAQSKRLISVWKDNPELRVNSSNGQRKRFQELSEEEKVKFRLNQKRVMSQPEVRMKISEGMKKSDKQRGFNNPSSKKSAIVYDKLYDKHKDLINYTNISNDELLSLFKKEGESLKLINFFHYISYREDKKILSKRYNNNFSFYRTVKLKTWIEQKNNSYEELEQNYPILIEKKIKQILEKAELYFKFRNDNKNLPDHFLEKQIPGFIKFLELADYLEIIKIDKKVKLNKKKLLDSLYTIYGETEKEFNRNKMKKDKCSITFFNLENSLSSLIKKGKIICK